MEIRISGKTIFYLSILILAYFAFLFFNSYLLGSENVVIGFFQQLLTIPLLIIQLVLLFICISRIVQKRNGSLEEYLFPAVIILLLTNLVTLLSLFLS